VKIITSIPEDIAEVFRSYPGINRMDLIKETGITEYHAKIYIHIWLHGRVVAHYETRLKPKTGKIMTALILGDMQIPYQDDLAIKIALDWGLSQNPDMVILDGDIFDCYKISSWKTDPLRPHFGAEVDMSVEKLEQIDEEINSCKSVKEKIFISGNHEDRLIRELWSGSRKFAGLRILTVSNVYRIEALGWKYVDNAQMLREEMQPFKLGKLSVLHGHEVKVNYSVVNIPRIYYQRCLVNLLVAHHHRTQENIERKLDNSHDGAWSIGCLCKLSQEYSPMNKWNHGFAIVKWDAQGDFSVENKKIINGKVL
jgi:predicted phosphodiesterase